MRIQKLFAFSLLLALFLGGCSTNTTPTPINSTLNPPKDIKILADTNTIAFEWAFSDDYKIKGYQIFRKKANEGSFSKIATLDSRFITHFADNNLEANTTYQYKFNAYDENKILSYDSEIITANTLAINAVNFFQAISNYPRKVKLLWNPHNDTRVNGYIIEKKDKNGNWKKLTEINNRLLVEYIDRNLEDQTTYEYRIFAYNKNKSLSMPSQISTATTKPKPEAITTLSATSNIPKSIILKWQAHENPEVIKYKISRSTFLNSFFTELITLPSHTTEYQDNINDNGKEYHYKITAINKDGIESLDSPIITGSTLPIPAKPIISYAQIEGNAVVVRWNPQDNRAKEYVVYKKDFKFFGETLRYTKVLTPEFIDREITPGGKYYYSVASIDENGLESEKSQEVILQLPSK